MSEALSPPAWVTVVVVSGVFGLLVHELGHVLAAGAMGGTGLRLRLGWPALRIEATLPDEPGFEIVFLLAGALANFGGAAALWGFGGVCRVAALVQIMVAVAALLPIGTSDGARLWAHLKAQRDGA